MTPVRSINGRAAVTEPSVAEQVARRRRLGIFDEPAQAGATADRRAPAGAARAVRDDGRPIRVGILTPAYGDSHGALGRHVEQTANAIARAGADIEVMLHAPIHAKAAPAGAGVSIDRFPPPLPGTDSALSPALWRHLRERGPHLDVLHAHGEATLPALLAVRDAAAHLAITPHWYASAQTHLRHLAQGRVFRFDRSVLAAADRVLCVSRSEALQVARHQPGANVEVVPNGFDTEAIAHAIPFESESKAILTVDRLTRWSGIQRVASALLALPADYELIVVGGGRGRSGLEAHVDYLGLSQRVRFLGAVSDPVLHRWMRTAAVVATLKEESLWGATLLSAACAGAPVVASDISANREAAEVLRPEQVGFVSRRASPFAIAEAVQQLARTGRRSRASAVPTWQQAADRTIAVYKSVLRDGS
jgi:glycosyltransferase involved in cell wall biosynthesis